MSARPRPVCRYPGCERPARLGEGRGRPPEYCELPGHHRRAADKERARLLAEAHRVPPALELDTDPAELLAYIAELRRELADALAEIETLKTPPVER